ncbi:DUF4148 domain-containing protein [Pollutimonas sp. H1-120]|uniref:DUF4148 domain-containing protein n=1 Tax=Pollutimonas sp. H1-120 TaxID=3148824 RepID=UPI003B5175DA
MHISRMYLVTAVLFFAATATAGAQQMRESVHSDRETKQSVTEVQRESKTVAEVQADLALWKRAGMDKFSWAHPDTFSPRYRAAYAEYIRLRSGPEYQLEVQRQSAK